MDCSQRTSQGAQCIFHELQRLLLNIGKTGLFQVANHMGWHSENTCDLVDLKFSRFQKLRLFRGDADRLCISCPLQNGDLISIAAAAEGGLPALPNTLRVFNGPRMLQNTAGCCAVSKELRTILLTGNGHADGVFRHSDRAVATKPVKAKPLGYAARPRGFSRTTVPLTVRASSVLTVYS